MVKLVFFNLGFDLILRIQYVKEIELEVLGLVFNFQIQSQEKKKLQFQFICLKMGMLFLFYNDDCLDQLIQFECIGYFLCFRRCVSEDGINVFVLCIKQISERDGCEIIVGVGSTGCVGVQFEDFVKEGVWFIRNVERWLCS